MNRIKVNLMFGVIAAFAMSACLRVGTPFVASAAPDQNGNAPDLAEIDNSRSELRGVIERYVADRGSLSRSYPIDISPFAVG